MEKTAFNFKYDSAVLVPFVLVTVGFIVNFLLINFSIKGYEDFKIKLDSLNSTKQVLTKKVNTLRQVTIAVPDKLSFINLAIPEKDAVIMAVSQIKTMSSEQGLLVSNIKSGNSINIDKTLSKSAVTFDVEGPKETVLSFIASFSKTLPIVNLQRIKIAETNGTLRATLSFNVFSDDLPVKISAVSEAVESLTAEEIEKLSEISTYRLPPITTTTSRQDFNKQDLFN